MLTYQSSSFISYIRTDVLRGTCDVQLKDGKFYTYYNVSRRALLNLEFNKSMSLGFWFNRNCVNSNATYSLRFDVNKVYFAAWSNTSSHPFIHPIIIMFFKPNTIESSTVRNILLDPSTHQVIVQYKGNNKTYLYENVSSEAIVDVFFGEITSFGKFVNAYCKGNMVTVVG